MDDSDGNEDGPSRKRSRKNEGKYKKSPLITDLLMDMAKSGQLVGGKKLSECDADVNPRDKGKFVSAMALVEELWTEEEVSSFDLNACHCDMYFECIHFTLEISSHVTQELFLRSPPTEIFESLEELKIITATIGERCLAKLCEWEGREDSGRQKPSVITVGIRARKAFMARSQVAQEDGDEDDKMEENVEEVGEENLEEVGEDTGEIDV